MPLRDHFRSPVDDRHAWTGLHGWWPLKMIESILDRLPPEFLAEPTTHLGSGVEIDVGTFRQALDPSPELLSHGSSNGTATATLTESEPTLSVETELRDVDDYEVQIFDLSRARQLVAAIEIVSPSNKDRPETRQAFVTKCAALLQQNVCVTIVDVVTTRQANLYAELLGFYNRRDPTVATPPSCTYAVTCRGRVPRTNWVLDAWHRPLVVGQPLPRLPIWLTPELVITLDLEVSYEETCRVLRIA
jgi:hypothetical protein